MGTNKTIQFLSAISLSLFLLASCSKSDTKPKFDYDLNTLYGTWHVTHIKTTAPGDTYISVVGSAQEAIFPPTFITFNSDGTFSGRGNFGNGSGKYTAQGNEISTTVDGQKYYTYEVLSLSGSSAEIHLIASTGESVGYMKVEKQ